MCMNNLSVTHSNPNCDYLFSIVGVFRHGFHPERIRNEERLTFCTKMGKEPFERRVEKSGYRNASLSKDHVSQHTHKFLPLPSVHVKQDVLQSVNTSTPSPSLAASPSSSPSSSISPSLAVDEKRGCTCDAYSIDCGFSITCSRCDQWYHAKCVGFGVNSSAEAPKSRNGDEEDEDMDDEGDDEEGHEILRASRNDSNSAPDLADWQCSKCSVAWPGGRALEIRANSIVNYISKVRRARERVNERNLRRKEKEEFKRRKTEESNALWTKRESQDLIRALSILPSGGFGTLLSKSNPVLSSPQEILSSTPNTSSKDVGKAISDQQWLDIQQKAGLHRKSPQVIKNYYFKLLAQVKYVVIHQEQKEALDRFVREDKKWKNKCGKDYEEFKQWELEEKKRVQDGIEGSVSEDSSSSSSSSSESESEPKSDAEKTAIKKPIQQYPRTTPFQVGDRKSAANPMRDIHPYNVKTLCAEILDELLTHEASSPFRAPVDPVALGIPYYFEIIRYPMDLATVKSNLSVDAYTHPQHFAADVRLTFANCRDFNDAGSYVYNMANVVEREFDSLFEKIPRGQRGKRVTPAMVKVFRGDESDDEEGKKEELKRKAEMRKEKKERRRLKIAARKKRHAERRKRRAERKKRKAEREKRRKKVVVPPPTKPSFQDLLMPEAVDKGLTVHTAKRVSRTYTSVGIGVFSVSLLKMTESNSDIYFSIHIYSGY